jgi:hypothetical protein
LARSASFALYGAGAPCATISIHDFTFADVAAALGTWWTWLAATDVPPNHVAMFIADTSAASWLSNQFVQPPAK